jgi:hypothetical protein
MKVKEYLELSLNGYDNVTFIIAKAEKYEHAPGYYPVYKTTPMLRASEWKNSNDIQDYIILNNKQKPIDWLSGAKWGNQFEWGRLECMLIIKQEELYTLYSKEEADSLEKYIEKEINNQK